jgi:hypothetical protein
VEDSDKSNFFSGAFFGGGPLGYGLGAFLLLPNKRCIILVFVCC